MSYNLDGLYEDDIHPNMDDQVRIRQWKEAKQNDTPQQAFVANRMTMYNATANGSNGRHKAVPPSPLKVKKTRENLNPQRTDPSGQNAQGMKASLTKGMFTSGNQTAVTPSVYYRSIPLVNYQKENASSQFSINAYSAQPTPFAIQSYHSNESTPKVNEKMMYVIDI